MNDVSFSDDNEAQRKDGRTFGRDNVAIYLNDGFYKTVAEASRKETGALKMVTVCFHYNQKATVKK